MNAGIYVHIPFCKQKCLYCDFVSGCGNQETFAKYQKAILSEIDHTEINQPVDTIFFGGGTPSIYPPEYLEEILNHINQKVNLNDQMEITMEANPGTLTDEHLRQYRKMGINRLSIGLQSADDKELLKLGRIHTYEQFLQSYESARKVGFTNINIDLMSAIPGQTMESYQNTLSKVVMLKPEHISAYSLIVEEGTPFYKMYSEGSEYQNQLPDEDTERDMYYHTREYLKENGYNRYEISNYAKVGYECRHNKKYWERADYYGFGVAASSLVNNLRYTNTSKMDEYINKNENGIIKFEQQQLSLKDQMEEYMYLGLREMQGVSVMRFEKEFHHSMNAVYGKIIKQLIEEKLCILEKDRLFLTDRGIDVSNAVLAEFLLDDGYDE